MLKSGRGIEKGPLNYLLSNSKKVPLRNPLILSKLADKKDSSYRLGFHPFRIRYLLKNVQNTLNRSLILAHKPLSFAEVANSELSAAKAVFGWV